MHKQLMCPSFLLTGTGISRAFSPESSSDSGNETNSSEMTESSEQTAGQRLSENAMRLLVATTEGYQPLQEEKTEFPVSPCTRGSIPKPPRSPSRRKDLAVQSTVVPSMHNLPSSDNPETTPEAKADMSLGKYLVKSHSSTLLNTGKRLKAIATEGRRIKKNKDAPGKYNTFSGRESNRRRQLVVKEFCERFQSPVENEPSGSQVAEPRGSREDLTGSNSSLPTKKHLDSEQTQICTDDHQILPPLRQGVARLCEYHLAKRISSLQNEARSSLQSSQSSSLDVGCSSGSSASATPVDSPLCATDCKSSFSGSSSSLLLTSRDLHPHADASLLRKMLPNVHPPGSNPPLSVRSSKIKETTGTARRSNLLSDLHANSTCYSSVKSINTKEGREAYRQLINYLTVSQMHQGGKLISAGIGGCKKNNRRHIANSSLFLDTVKSNGNIIKCPCMPPSPSLLRSNPSSASQTVPKIYHSTTLPAKLKRSPDLHAQRPVSNLEIRPNHSEKRRSFSGLKCELEKNFNHDQFLSLNRNQSEGIPLASTEDMVMSECKMTLAVQQTPNDSFCLSSVACTEDRRMLLRGEGVSPANLPRRIKTCAVPLPLPPPPPLPPPFGFSLSKSTSYNGPTQVSDVPLTLNHLTSHGLNQFDTNSLNRDMAIRRSTSILNAATGSNDTLTENSRAASFGRIQQDHLQATEPLLQIRPSKKKLSKSLSQGSVVSQTMGWSVSNRDNRTDFSNSAIFPLQKDIKQMRSTQRLDINPWTCNGPFSYCFFKKKNQSVEDEGDIGDGLRRQICGLDEAGPCQYNVDTTGEQLYAEVLNNMTFGDRLARINALKEHTYVYPVVFSDVRRDASELIAVVRSSVGRSDKGSPPMETEELAQYKHLLAIESKALGQACRRMAQAHGSPEEMLLAVSSSFQVLCCLAEVCMCLVRGVGASASQQQREVVAKVDEVVMNYLCLLRAAEGASGCAPGDQSVKTLDRHSSTMSAIVNTLTRSLKTLLNK